MITNRVASVNARLRNLARAQGVDYNRLERLYVQERLLARLAESSYQSQFVLKGGLLLYSYDQIASRPTRDVDLLGRGVTAEVSVLIKLFQKVCALELEDGVNFDTDNIQGSIIKERAEYEGVRLKLPGYLGKARQLLQLDLGFGDTVTPAPMLRNYPPLLTDDPIVLLSYPLETVVSEKLQAMVMLYTINTRYKDFYDVYQIATTKPLDGKLLKQAIEVTFKERNTHLDDASLLFTDEFIQDKTRQQQWQAFWQSLQRTDRLSFTEVMQGIKILLIENNILTDTP